jgi:hypothetical protein
MSGVVDQIVFAWAEVNLLRREDFGPVATSLEQSREEELVQWHQWLVARADLSGSNRERLPHSMCYWANGENAALLYRIPAPAGSSGSRPGIRTRALVGASHDLTPRDALALHDRLRRGTSDTDADPVWHMQGFGLSRIPLDKLAHEMASGAEILDHAARQCQAELSLLVAAALRAPTRPYSVVGVPADVYALLWGMFDVLDKVLDGMWTFSTYETSHRGWLPRVVFLPRWPSSEFGAVDRERVDLTRPSLPTDEYAKAAAWLVDCYAEMGQPGVARALAHARVDDGQRPATRIQRILTHVGPVVVAAQPPPLPLIPAPAPVPAPRSAPAPVPDGSVEPVRPAVAALLNKLREWTREDLAELQRGLAELDHEIAGAGDKPSSREIQSQKPRRQPVGILSDLFDGHWLSALDKAGYPPPTLVLVVVMVAALVALRILSSR